MNKNNTARRTFLKKHDERGKSERGGVGGNGSTFTSISELNSENFPLKEMFSS